MKVSNGSADLPATGLYEFGNFRLDAGKRVLERDDGSPVPLTPKVFDTLLVLVSHAGEVLSKERLMDAVWADVIVEENNLNKNISTLRRVLGETPDSHHYIVTLPGRGYRFVAEVRRRQNGTSEFKSEITDGDGDTPPAPTSVELFQVTPIPAAHDHVRPRSAGVALGILGALILCLTTFFFWRGQVHRIAVRPSPNNIESSPAATKASQNHEANLLYLRGREAEAFGKDAPQVESAMRFYQRAVDLDPAFSVARARLSMAASRLFDSIHAPELPTKARFEAEETVRLDPSLGEGHLALSHYYLWCDYDYPNALNELARASELLPNLAEVPLTEAYIYKRQKKYQDRLAALRRAEKLDPKDPVVLGFLTNTLRWLRRWPEAMETFEHWSEVRPDRTLPRHWIRAADEFRLTAEIDVLTRALSADAREKVPSGENLHQITRFETAVLQRDYDEAARILAGIPSEAFDDPLCDLTAHPKIFHEALLAVVRNQNESDRIKFLKAAQFAATTRMVGRLGEPNETAHAESALLNAFLGQKEQAIREAIFALDIEPEGTPERNDLKSALAMVYAWTGESEKALDLIEELLRKPGILQRGAIYNMTLADLKFRWQWDPLRAHSRFHKIVNAPEPATVY